MWRFELIPEELRPEVREMVEREDWRALLKVQNKYKPSGHIICCNLRIIRDWFVYAYENGLI